MYIYYVDEIYDMVVEMCYEYFDVVEIVDKLSITTTDNIYYFVDMKEAHKIRDLRTDDILDGIRYSIDMIDGDDIYVLSGYNIDGVNNIYYDDDYIFVFDKKSLIDKFYNIVRISY